MTSDIIPKKKAKIKSRVVLLIMVLSLASFAYAGASMIYGESKEDIQLPAFLGNKTENVDLLTAKDTGEKPFSFFVVGDTRLGDFFSAIYKHDIRGDAPDFGVILGDFVKGPTAEYHRRFMTDFSSWGVRVPVFLVAGNRDIVTTDDPGELFYSFTPQSFEAIYGPDNFHFTHDGCLFVVLDDVNTETYLPYLADVLGHRKGDTRMTFVFTHASATFVSPAITGRDMQGEKRFLSLIEKYNVDYVFSGDYHSYVRTRIKDTTFIVSGGGMDKIGEKNHATDPYHAMVIRVDPTTKVVNEEIYAGKSRFLFTHAVAGTMLTQAFPLLEYQEKAGLPILWGSGLITAMLGMWFFVLSGQTGRSLSLAGAGSAGGSSGMALPRVGEGVSSGRVLPSFGKAERKAFRRRIRAVFKGLDPLTGAMSLFQRIDVALSAARTSRYYQPVYGRVSKKSKRDCIERWDAMKKHLPSPPFSFLDTGCEIGYFTFMASESGAVAIGVERKKRLYDFAMMIRAIRKMDRTAFLNVGIDIDTVRSLPRVDMLCCLSIFHHWVSEWGFDTADRIFSTLCEKTTSIFFETGQPNESVDWKKKFAFMEPDIEGWIANYLSKKGFSKVECLGEYSTNRGDTRFLFFASK